MIRYWFTVHNTRNDLVATVNLMGLDMRGAAIGAAMRIARSVPESHYFVLHDKLLPSMTEKHGVTFL